RVSAAHPLYRDRHHLLDCRTASRMKGSPMNDSPSQEIAGRPRMRMRIFAVLALAWCATFLLLCVCQLVGLPLAIVVHPTGEDRVWTDLLEHSGKRTAQAWWAIASRNPLAPWWYEAFSPLIQKVPGGLYVARKLLDLFLACSVALFINELFGGRRPAVGDVELLGLRGAGPLRDAGGSGLLRALAALLPLLPQFAAPDRGLAGAPAPLRA